MYLQNQIFSFDPNFIDKLRATWSKPWLFSSFYHFTLGFLVVIDAKTMTLISHVTAHAEAKFGIHNR
jgi:hypothetical protein